MSTTEKIDWSKCDDVESVPGRVSGAWVIKGTRVQADAIVENARAGCTAEEITGPDIPRASPSTSSSACCASPRSHRPRTDEVPARRKRSKWFAPHTRHDVRTAPEMGWARYSNGQLLDEAEKAVSKRSSRGSKLAVSAESHRPKYRRHHFLHQCLAHHSHPATDGAARGRECLTRHFHLCHLSPSATIPAPACTHVLNSVRPALTNSWTPRKFLPR